MGLLRRKLSKEFKMTALRQLDSGVSIAVVARGCDIDASLLHRWRRLYSVRLDDQYWQTGHRQTRLRVQDTDPAQPRPACRLWVRKAAPDLRPPFCLAGRRVSKLAPEDKLSGFVMEGLDYCCGCHRGGSSSVVVGAQATR